MKLQDYTLMLLIANHGASYIPLLIQVLNNSMKGLINLKNEDHKCFVRCHIRLITPQNRNAKRINKQDKKHCY